MKNIFIYGVIISFVTTILQGWIASILWDWFIVNQFHVSHISIPVAIGISLVVSIFLPNRNHEDHSNKTTVELVTGVFVYEFALPIFSLCFGWVIHLFM